MNFSEEQIVEIQEAFSIFDTESIGEIKCKDLEYGTSIVTDF
jgi:Ca2+-binding EF-hand superfamily protein